MLTAFPHRALLGLTGCLALAPVASATTLRVDFNDGTNTQSGWESLRSTDSALGDSWSKNFTGGIGIDADPIGAITLDDRDRGAGNGGGSESEMWRDFLFASGSFSSAPGSGIRLTITGLSANTSYPIKIWAFDDSSSGGRAADWSGGGGGPERLSFPDGPDPSSLSDYTVTFDATTDGAGALVLDGIVSTTSPSGSHNVFINGLEIGTPVSVDGPTDIALSGNIAAKTAPIGTLVGTFTTTDPTPGDTFTYALAGGSGSDNNGEFAIAGDRLETDRDLSSLTGPLSLRVRSTDADGDWTEKVFSITLVNDSDADGLDDTWELTYFVDLTVATGTGNNDTDTLDNLGEQARGTNPKLADTDGDTLNDDLEDDSRVFNGPGDPGSSPLLPDTDGDGINDADELSLANGYVTDPNKQDSDGDGFPDPLEIAEGTSPTDNTDFPNTLLPLRLNEILARNDTDIDDGFGNREDWIEIYNPNNQVVNLDAYYLTDNAALLTKWSFPAINIPANGYLLVFASGLDTVDPGGNPHSNFQLSANGEYLAIVRPDGTTVDDSFAPAFPEQFTDISYGLPPAGGLPVFFQTSTPGAANSASQYPGVVKDTNFSIDRGFYSAPFDLVITSATPSATIRYTTDGSKPSPTSGTIYSAPITISTTTNVRAIAYLDTWLPTNVDTHTYIFVDDVALQPSDPPGWPAIWGTISQGTVPSDYEMDPRVVNDVLGIAGHTIQEALVDIPTVSLTMPQNSVTGGGSGIYTNPGSRTERECAIEYIHPDGTPGFQEDCALVPHGNSSRNPYRMQKHSLRLIFTSQYGTPKLRYPLFPDSDIEEFNKLVLRACFTDSWALASWSSGRYRPNDSMYIRDVWMKDSLKAMGQPSSHGNFVHLYVNGLYFGLHNLTERIEDDFFADHIGGAKEDWQINKDLSQSPSRWGEMMSVLNGTIASSAVYANAQNYIDVDNYIDYMLLHFYADSEDWPHHNGYAAANVNSGDGRFRFFVWDQEIALDKFSWNRYGDSRGGGAPFQRLRLNDEFKMRFADRVQKHLFNDGALSESESIARFLARCTEIDKAIHAESARWGDVQATTPYGNTAGSSTNIDADYYPPTINNPIYFTREQHWLVERDNVVGHYIPTIHDTSDSRALINELRSNNLFPSIDAPVFGQHGGVVPTAYQLAITAGTGDIYYTLDGSDPREAGGGINLDAGMLSGGATTITLIDLEETGWRYLDSGAAQSDSQVVVDHPSYGTSDWKHPDYDDSGWGTGQAMLGYNTINGRTLNGPVGFGPDSGNKYPTTYFRKEFQVSDAPSFTELSVRVVRDDGAILYLNGRELKRSNMDAGNQSYGDYSSGAASPEGELTDLGSYTLNPGELVEGTNVLAVEVHQQSANSSDLGIDVELKGIQPNAGGSGVTLNQTGIVSARALNGGEWSALTEAAFIVGIPASASNLAVTELYYNPPGSVENTEFIELMNIDDSDTIDLTDVTLTGITYAFPAGFTLGPLERVVIVKDQVAFAAAYNTAGMNLAPGGFAPTSLDNNGEEIALIAQDGVTDIRRFTYDDKPNWPTAPDGDGYSLVLVAPESDPPHGDPFSWRPSTTTGGSPGASDAATPFSGDPDLDGDADGLNAFLEHAAGTSDSDAGSAATPVLGSGLFEDGTGTFREYLTISYRRSLAADDVIFEAQVATELVTWNSLGTTYVSATHNGDGTETVTYRSTTPLASISREFIRLRVSSRE